MKFTFILTNHLISGSVFAILFGQIHLSISCSDHFIDTVRDAFKCHHTNTESRGPTISADKFEKSDFKFFYNQSS